MSLTAKITAWIGAALAAADILLSVLTYGTDQAESATTSTVVHESRHVRVESDVKHIGEVVKEQNKVIQAQLSEGREMRIIILKKIMED